MRLISGLLLMTLCLPAGAGIYRTVGPDGQVTYSDQPSPGAEEVKPSAGSTYTPVPAAPVVAGESNPAPSASLSPYTSLTFSQPQHDESLRENSGRVEVILRLDPSLISGAQHALVVTLDGEPLPGAHLPGAPIVLENVDRGTHTLGASVVNDEGKELISAEPVTFHLQRYSVQSPAAKKKQQPPPKPKPKPKTP